MPRRVGVGVDREAGERDARVAVGDAVLRLPVLGPVDQRVVGKPVVAEPAPDLVQRAIADHVSSAGPGYSPFFSSVSMVDAAAVVEEPAPNGVTVCWPETFPISRIFWRQLIVDPHAADIAGLLPVQLRVERRVPRRPGAGQRVLLVLVVDEVMQLVLENRTADRRAVLLIADGEHLVGDRIGRVEAGCSGNWCGTAPKTCWCRTS